MILSAKVVHETLLDCLFPEGDGDVSIIEVPADSISVDGIMNRFIFRREAVERHRTEIEAMLAELPDNFQKDKGGGWSFLQACMDRQDNQWGEHRDMAALFALGMAIGRVEYLLPRPMWGALPGGMPYLVVTNPS